MVNTVLENKMLNVSDQPFSLGQGVLWRFPLGALQPGRVCSRLGTGEGHAYTAPPEGPSCFPDGPLPECQWCACRTQCTVRHKAAMENLRKLQILKRYLKSQQFTWCKFWTDCLVRYTILTYREVLSVWWHSTLFLTINPSSIKTPSSAKEIINSS